MSSNGGDGKTKKSEVCAAAMLVTFVLFGHWMEMRSRRGSFDALGALLRLAPTQANVIQPGGEVETVIRLLRPGLGGGEQAQRWPAATRQSLDRRIIPSASVNGTAASASFFQNPAWYSGLDVAMIMRIGAETSPR